MNHDLPQKRLSGKRGQTVIYLCVIMVILVIMMIFLVDVQYFVRLRQTNQNGVDAAVLTAAKWQGKSLNMVGELNLVKASTLMLTTIPTGLVGDSGVLSDQALEADTSMETLIASDQMITEMQTRILYVGPLLGYISAQQAAKNNGLRPNYALGQQLQDHIEYTLEDIGDEGSFYEEIYESKLPYNNYMWHDPYKAMLQRLADEGITAKAVNSRYMAGAPTLVGDGAGMLMDPGFYDAVWNFDFCYFYMRDISSTDEFTFDVATGEDAPFFPGSEFLNLYVGFQRHKITSKTWPDFPGTLGSPEAAGVMDDLMDDRNLERLDPDQEGLSELNWAVYDNSSAGWGGDGMVDDDFGVDEYGFPNTSARYPMINYYLRNDGFKGEYQYGGASVRMYTQSEPSLLSGDWNWEHGKPVGNSKNFGSSDALGGLGDKDDIRRLADSEERLRNLKNQSTVFSSSAAKPFGKLGDGLPPYVSGIVLPVFTTVRLIPAALVEENEIERNYEFYKFLIEYFGNPDYPDVPEDVRQKYNYYITAIEAFLDHESAFHIAWENKEIEWDEYMLGPDGVPDSGDEPERHPCEPIPSPWPPGGPGGPTNPDKPDPPGGPGIIH